MTKDWHNMDIFRRNELKALKAKWIAMNKLFDNDSEEVDYSEFKWNKNYKPNKIDSYFPKNSVSNIPIVPQNSIDGCDSTINSNVNSNVNSIDQSIVNSNQDSMECSPINLNPPSIIIPNSNSIISVNNDSLINISPIQYIVDKNGNKIKTGKLEIDDIPSDEEEDIDILEYNINPINNNSNQINIESVNQNLNNKENNSITWDFGNINKIISNVNPHSNDIIQNQNQLRIDKSKSINNINNVSNQIVNPMGNISKLIKIKSKDLKRNKKNKTSKAMAKTIVKSKNNKKNSKNRNESDSNEGSQMTIDYFFRSANKLINGNKKDDKNNSK